MWMTSDEAYGLELKLADERDAGWAEQDQQRYDGAVQARRELANAWSQLEGVEVEDGGIVAVYAKRLGVK